MDKRVLVPLDGSEGRESIRPLVPARWRRGSVTESVMCQAPVPVFLLRRPEKGITGRRRDRAFRVTGDESANGDTR